MKNIIQAIKYFFKNFFVLAIFALPAAVLFGLKYNASSFVDYLLNLNNIAQDTLGNIYFHFSLLPSFNVLSILGWLLAALLSFSLLSSYIERHMKYGIKSFFKAFTSLNYSILAILPTLITIVAFNELFAFLLAILINLLKLSPSSVVFYVLPAIYLLINVLLLTVSSFSAMWIPIKLITGYSNADAIRYSIRLCQSRQLGLIFGFAFPLFLMVPVMMVLKNFVPFDILNPIVYILFYIFMFGYYAAYIMVSYFDFSGTQRKDIVKKIF